MTAIRVIGVFFIVALLFGSLIADSEESRRPAVLSLFKEYVEAHETGDFERFEAIVTREYLKQLGGEKRARQGLKETSLQKKKRTVIDVKIEPKEKNRIFAQYRSDRSESTEPEWSPWFELTTRNGKTWRINQYLHDYEPGAK